MAHEKKITDKWTAHGAMDICDEPTAWLTHEDYPGESIHLNCTDLDDVLEAELVERAQLTARLDALEPVVEKAREWRKAKGAMDSAEGGIALDAMRSLQAHSDALAAALDGLDGEAGKEEPHG